MLAEPNVLNGTPASIGFAIGWPIYYSSNIASLKKTNRPMILVAESLTLKEAELADLNRFQGLILESGGAASHATIVARSYGIPIVVGIKIADMHLTEKSMIIVDGFDGKVISNSDEKTMRRYRKMRLRYNSAQRQFLRESDKPAVTRGGRRVEVEER